jgi:hypothetical protein
VAKKKAQRGKRSDKGAIASAHSAAMAAVGDQIRASLTGRLGTAGLKRVKLDLALSAAVGGGVLAWVPLEQSGNWTWGRLRRESPLIGVLVSTIPLEDPVTRTRLAPGAYAVGVRLIGQALMALDVYGGKKKTPVLSTQAMMVGDWDPPTDDGKIHEWLFDIDVEWPSKDGFYPPPNGVFCISFWHWTKCWWWDWPWK